MCVMQVSVERYLDSPEEAAAAGVGEGTDPAEIDISKSNNCLKWNACLESAERN